MSSSKNKINNNKRRVMEQRDQKSVQHESGFYEFCSEFSVIDRRTSDFFPLKGASG
jgi:hypothetical protein